MFYFFFQVSEARPLSTRFCYNTDRDSDGSTDQDSKGYPHGRSDFTGFANRSRFTDIWGTDLDNKKDLFAHSLGSDFKQRGTGLQENNENRNNFNINNSSQVPTIDKRAESEENFGGKLCHPKMRAKLLFRSGDFDNMSWGYQHEETESDTMKSTDIHDEKSIDSNKNIDSNAFVNDTNGNYLPNTDCLSPMSTISSDNDEEMNSPQNDLDSSLVQNEVEMNGNTIIETPLNPSLLQEGDTRNGLDPCSLQEGHTGIQTSITECEKKDKPHEYDIWVTEVTHDCLTVTFMESPTERGFFKERCEQ